MEVPQGRRNRLVSLRFIISSFVVLIVAGDSPGQASPYKLAFSTISPLSFAGGSFKSTSTKNFPISRHLASALTTLNVSGLREPHWHNPAEWAIVLEGKCRATSLEQGKTRPSDTFDYETGDVWYFGPNIGHAILGLEPSGCTYLTVYDNGTFDEYSSSFDLSTWISRLPRPILSQHLNTSTALLSSNLGILSPASSQNGTLRTTDVNQFIVQGPLSILDYSPPALPVQIAKELHRFPLKSSSLPQVDVAGGGTVTYVDDTLFPIAKNIWGGILHLAPNALRVSHWHLNADEYQFVANGSNIEIGNFLQDGTLAVNTYQSGDVGLSPQGAAHYLKNNGNTPADVLVIFNADVNTGIDLSWTLGSFPNSWIAATLNTTTNFTSGLAKKYKMLTSNIMPASLAVPSSQ
ncbi:hypothetical protein CVIRNUC_000312 [Coccomyxa viridis]|uniref:Cupin type-1 domain-containing protein n=1 Tax=Coccomyxa viridis TaxID=1274662 RepID=A0AAV1HUG3_9CHLO|nr:hypothetical protein CVIRNUC_000312 [Coccomyxa viridis]